MWVYCDVCCSANQHLIFSEPAAETLHAEGNLIVAGQDLFLKNLEIKKALFDVFKPHLM